MLKRITELPLFLQILIAIENLVTILFNAIIQCRTAINVMGDLTVSCLIDGKKQLTMNNEQLIINSVKIRK